MGVVIGHAPLPTFTVIVEGVEHVARTPAQAADLVYQAAVRARRSARPCELEVRGPLATGEPLVKVVRIDDDGEPLASRAAAEHVEAHPRQPLTLRLVFGGEVEPIPPYEHKPRPRGPKLVEGEGAP